MSSASGFSTRNAYYLRISLDTVLSMYLYIEQPYVDWMTDYTLQKVLLALRPLIRPKLALEATADKKAASTPEVIVGDDFRFCFFLRSNAEDRHVVLLKDRRYVARATEDWPTEDAGEEEGAPSPPVTRAVEGKGRKRVREESEDVGGPIEIKPETEEGSAIDDLLASSAADAPRRNVPRRQALFDYGEDGEEETIDEDIKPDGLGEQMPQAGGPDQQYVDDVEEKKKAKPALEMHYQGFSIYSSQLAIIVEPYPLPAATNPLRRSSSVSVPPTPRPRASSTFSTSTAGTRRTFDRTPSASPWPSLRPSANSRSGTPANEPLFRPMTPLGDEDAEEEARLDDERRLRWASWRDRSLSVVPSRGESLAPMADDPADERESDVDVGGGMTNLSQSLMNVGGRQGVGEEDD